MHAEPFWGLSIKYVTLFLANFDPLPLSHFVTHPGPPRKYVTHLGPPRILLGLVQKPGQTPPVQILSQLFAGAFVWGLLSGVIFVRTYFCQNSLHLLQQKVRNHFKFHVSYVGYDNFFISVTSHALDPLPSVTNCHTFSDPLSPLERDVLYGRPPTE